MLMATSYSRSELNNHRYTKLAEPLLPVAKALYNYFNGIAKDTWFLAWSDETNKADGFTIAFTGIDEADKGDKLNTSANITLYYNNQAVLVLETHEHGIDDSVTTVKKIGALNSERWGPTWQFVNAMAVKHSSPTPTEEFKIDKD